jgi:hypothetical protein
MPVRPDQQIDQEEGKDRHQAQGEQIEGALPLHPFVDRLQALAEALLDPVAQQEARDQEGQRGADGDEAKETITTPHSRPKTAPPARVSKAAPGSDSAAI